MPGVDGFKIPSIRNEFHMCTSDRAAAAIVMHGLRYGNQSDLQLVAIFSAHIWFWLMNSKKRHVYLFRLRGELELVLVRCK
jgi:hypothetical protein